ncbi:AAA family ATPase [Streptomyces sp. NPDC088116]|uniref:AAA family ATPase n=1 Tax=Streptomyces sp. NPDC088116 TaxID=3365825 RepID=UPI003814E2A0
MSWASRRQDYVAEFGALVREVGPHQGCVIALHGGPGTGKTTLLRRFREQAAESGALFLAATGFRNERSVPFATIEQLTYSSGIPEEARAAVARLWEQGVPRDASDSDHVGRLRDLTSVLEAVAREKPLVIAVDDVLYADALSQACLLHLARRAQSSGIVIVMTSGQTEVRAEGTPERSDFLGVPGCRMRDILLLPEAEVRQLLEGELGAETAEETHTAVHRVSGGNPALVQALVRDHRTSLRTPPEHAAAVGGDAVVGEAFERSYLGRLLRHPHLMSCVRALAVLDRSSTPARIGQLLDRCPDRVAVEIAELESAGLLEGGWFRHPAARRAVMGAPECAKLHSRAAGILRAEGAPVTTVAEHLVAGDGVLDDTEVAVLLRASRQLLGEGRADAALRCLRLADRAELDEPRRVEIIRALVGALWCVNPAAAEPEASRLMSAMRSGALDARDIHGLIAWLLWFGRAKEAGEAIAHLMNLFDPRSPSDREQLTATRTVVAHFGPALLSALPESDPPSGELDTMAAAHLEYAARASIGQLSAPAGRRELLPLPADLDETVGGAALPPMVRDRRIFWDRDALALLELIQHGRLDLADKLCGALLARLPVGGSPARHAIFLSIHARVAVQRGDMTAAAARAAGALEHLPHHGWGVVVGSPLSTLVHAYTAMGRHEVAASYLEYPVPEEMFQSTIGLFYLVARGYHSLATGRAYAALNDFTACSPMAEQWRSSSRHLLGWRTGAAEAYLAIGKPHRARPLVERELAVIDPGPSTFRGNALRVLAAASPPDQRETLLGQAVDVLRQSDNRLALAQALADLSQSHADNGRSQEAHTLRQEAQQLSHHQGDRTSLQPEWTAGQDRTATVPPADAPEGVDRTLLSNAEWRVAVLASEGKSNRQIARHLYITVSTVEQHLTRVYRKLSVRRRAELSRLFRPLTNGMDVLAD